jgi:hypothetical protein
VKQAIHVGSPAGYQGRRIRFRPAAHGSGHHTPAAPDFHDAEFVAVAGREEELDAVDQLFVPLPAQVLDVEVALRIDFDVERTRSQVLGREDAAQPQCRKVAWSIMTSGPKSPISDSHRISSRL